MDFAVFKAQYERTRERVSHHVQDSTFTWYEVKMVPVAQLKSATIEGAMVEAKRLGFSHPILGEVA